jgi:FtsH-binding integral membrane protein
MFKNLTKKFSTNVALMSVFTLAESYMVSYICAFYTKESVLLSAIATLSSTLGLTFYALTTKKDFTKKFHFFNGKNSSNLAFITSLMWIILSISLVNIFFLKSSLIVCAIAAIMAIIYSAYILIDTQLIMGGKNKELSLDDYILGAVILYVDIIQLFLKILQLLGKKKDD